MGLPARRLLFLKWLLLNALAVVGFAVMALEYHSRVRGASLVVIPAILAVGVYASLGAGRLCWQAHDATPRTKARILHDAQYVTFWAWVCQMLGILATVIGFWLLLSDGADAASIGSRIQEGGGVALLGTFVGVAVSLVLMMCYRLIEHDLEG